MAFDPFLPGEIESGDPNKQELWQKTLDNFDDHEARIIDLEAATLAFIPIGFRAHGRYLVRDGVAYQRITFDMRILAARLLIFNAGTAGTTEVDALVSSGGGAYSSIFSTRPSLGFAGGDLATPGSGGISTNQVLSTTTLSAGDLLRYDIKARQTAAKGMALMIEFEVDA